MVGVLGISFFAAQIAAAPPALLVLDTTGTNGVSSSLLKAASQQIREAAANCDCRLLEVETASSNATACIDRACIRRHHEQTACDFILVSQLARRGSFLDLRIDLFDAQTGEPLFQTMNSGELRYETATLDLPALTTDVLAALHERLPAPRLRSVARTIPAAEHRTLPALPDPKPLSRSHETDHRHSHLALGGETISNETPSGERAVRGCQEYGAKGQKVWLVPKEWSRYKQYTERNWNPMPPHAWAADQNKESDAVDVVWIASGVIFFLSLGSNYAFATLLAAVTLPTALITAFLDVADVGAVGRCVPKQRRAWSRVRAPAPAPFGLNPTAAANL